MNSTSVKKYINTAKAYAKHLVSHPAALSKLETLINQRGHEYFGTNREPFTDIEFELITNNNTDAHYIQVLNKADFTKAYIEETGSDNVYNDEAAFEDAYRHTIIVSVEDMDNPRLVDVRPDVMSRKTDWVLTWDKVQELPRLFPDGNIIAVHIDMSTPFIPIPTIKSSGGTRKRNNKKNRHTQRKSSSRKRSSLRCT